MAGVDHPPALEMEEWSRKEMVGVRLSAADRTLQEQINADGRLRIDELRDRVRIESRSWVGVVGFDTFELRVTPKLAGGSYGVAEMVDFAADLGALHRLPAPREIETGGASLFDLIAFLFAEECERIVNAGLLSDYAEQEDDLPVVRGRLLADRQVRERFGRIDRLICRFDEREQDVWENQWVAVGLEACAPRVRHPSVLRRIHRLRAIFAEVSHARDFDWTRSRDPDYHRLNAHYRPAHELASIILQTLGVRDLLSLRGARSFAFLLDMNGLFERFTHRLIEHLLRGEPYRVYPQRGDRSLLWDADAHRPYARVIPDLLVEGYDPEASRLAIDAKYKLYDRRKISTSDIYQMFLYAQAYRGTDSEARPIGLIVYPADSGSLVKRRLQVRDARSRDLAEILAVGIPIPALLREIRPGGAGPVMAELMELLLQRLGAARANLRTAHG